MFKQPVKLELTSSGHYCVNLREMSNPVESEPRNENDILTVTEATPEEHSQIRKESDNLTVTEIKPEENKLLDGGNSPENKVVESVKKDEGKQIVFYML